MLVDFAVTEYVAMADTGSQHTILSPKVADDLGMDSDRSKPVELAFAGREQDAYPASVSLSLLPPAGLDVEPVAWEADVVVASHWVAWFDVLLGQRGLFNLFTATFSGHAAAFAIEGADAFDQRFEVPPVDLGEGPHAPRLTP